MCSLFKYFVLWWVRFVNYSLAVPLLYYVNYLSNSLVPIWYLSWIVYFNIFSFLRGWFIDYYNVSNTVCLSFWRIFHIKRAKHWTYRQKQIWFHSSKVCSLHRSSHWNQQFATAAKTFQRSKYIQVQIHGESVKNNRDLCTPLAFGVFNSARVECWK